MKTALAALAAIALLVSAAPQAHTASAPQVSTTTVVGTIKAIKDKSGEKTVAVSVKTANGYVLVPSELIENFAPYDGRTMKICCSVVNNNLIPRCVLSVKAPPPDKKR